MKDSFPAPRGWLSQLTQFAASDHEMAKIFRFVGVGVLLTGLDFGLFRGCLAAGLGGEASRLVSSVISILASYPLHRRLSFRSAASGKSVVALYFGSRLAAMGLVQLSFWVAHSVAGLGDNPAFVVSTVLQPVFNYLFARLLIFK